MTEDEELFIKELNEFLKSKGVFLSNWGKEGHFIESQVSGLNIDISIEEVYEELDRLGQEVNK